MTDPLDTLLREALGDLDRRMDAHTAPRAHAPGRTPRPTRTRPAHWAPALAGLAVALVLVAGAWLVRPSPDGAPPPPGPAATVTTTPTGPSQTPDEATRDGVDRQVAALTSQERVNALEPMTPGEPTRVVVPGGEVVISRPPESLFDGDAGRGCLYDRGPVGQRVCPDYSEVLRLDTGGRVVKAWPIPELPPQWLWLDGDLVVLGRAGDGALPDSLLGRIDLRTGELTARVFPDRQARELAGALAGPWDFTGYADVWSEAAATDETGFGTHRILDRYDPETLAGR